MSAAIDPKILQINVLFASGSVPIPRSHPAYSGRGAAAPRRLEARLWSATLATVAGLLFIAAFSGGAAHYLLRIAESQSAAPGAIAAAIPEAPAAPPAVEAPATASAPAMPEPSLAADIAAPTPAMQRPAKRPVRTAKLLSLARREKPATALPGENLAFVPQDEILPAPMLEPREPLQPTPKADR